ncbi:hypothetical protein J4G52_08340 [Burkholderia cenocepacia]|nr:hypothetical protein [Burkholderia cenocepacia]MBO1853555.1 hypothetical protein [Burkholderia cenocepacia]MDI9650097.1 hypothetical protein [Burkholderia cenocepacia]MDR5645180.1 hypothetical protein [Burkholderia cenocepacia]
MQRNKTGATATLPNRSTARRAAIERPKKPYPDKGLSPDKARVLPFD